MKSLGYPLHSTVNQWAVGIHKGIASVFSLRYPEPEPKEERLTSSKSYNSMEVRCLMLWLYWIITIGYLQWIETLNLPLVYLFQEEITGQCINVYEWYSLEDERGSVTQPTGNYLCQPTSNNRYQLYKTRDFDNCTHLSMYNLLSPAGWRCRPGTAICENAQSVRRSVNLKSFVFICIYHVIDFQCCQNQLEKKNQVKIIR